VKQNKIDHIFQRNFIVFSLFLFVLFFNNCKDKARLADVPPNLEDIPAFAGQWNVQGIALPESILFLDPEKNVAILGKESFLLEMDSIGLRIRPTDREYAVGYFLFSEIREHSWVGTWEDQIVRLVRE